MTLRAHCLPCDLFFEDSVETRKHVVETHKDTDNWDWFIKHVRFELEGVSESTIIISAEEMYKGLKYP